MRRGRRGLALILVAGVLGLLAVLGAAFITMAQLERKASRQRLYATKAMLLARSGIEDALARLGAGQDPEALSNRYGGEDWVPNGKLSTLEAAQQAFHVTAAGTPADVDTCPVRHAMRPSFAAVIPGSLNAVTHRLDGRLRGYSGRLSDDLATAGNAYALKVESGGIHVNGGDPAVPTPPGAPPATPANYNDVLKRILGTLAEAIDLEDGMDDGQPSDERVGWRLVSMRPAEGWRDKGQLRSMAAQAGFLPQYEALEPYLALDARVDRKVIRPNADPDMVFVFPGWNGKGQPKSWADIKLGHETYPGLPGTKEPDFERIPVLPGGKLVGRAPVDLAWARSRRPVLVALLAGLKSVYLDESGWRPITTGDKIGVSLSAEIGLDWSPGSDLMTATDAILSFPGELATWQQWDAFCDTLSFTGTTEVAQAKRDILKANFNPNSRLNKFSPNRSLWRSVDKSDLLVYSTEFSFVPQPRELECVGRVLDPAGRLLASRVLRVSVAPAEVLTLSTQKEFVCESLGELSVAGDEGALRLPGFKETGKAPFVTENRGAGERTWGHALDMRGTYPGSWMNGTSAGASLQTYPEPVVDTGSGLSVRAADYDGSVQLATIETPDDHLYTVTATTQDMKLLARYTRDLDLDVSDAAPGRPPGNPRWMNQPDIRQVTYNGGGAPDPSQLAYGLLHPTRPNTLYPDGAYSEKDRALSYLDRGNANGLQGLISFWIKSNHAPPEAYPSPDRGHPYLKWTNFLEDVPGNNSRDQFFLLGDCFSGFPSISGPGVYLMFEIGHDTDDSGFEHAYCRNLGLAPHRWTLITMYYDFLASAFSMGLRVNLGQQSADIGTSVYGALCNPIAASDITLDHLLPDGSVGPHLLVLGAGRPQSEQSVPSEFGSGSDATFDELAIYDFGATGTDGAPPVLASNRFKEGRYYKESAYTGLAGAATNKAAEYFGPLIRLEGPRRISSLAWTQVVPRTLQAPLPMGGAKGIDGDAGNNGRILLELVDDTGASYLKDVSGRPIDRTHDRPAASPVARLVDAPFRIHAVFQPNLQFKDDTPVLDSLALDDVTVVYEPVGGRRILAFSDAGS